jgi:hypothetical protein
MGNATCTSAIAFACSAATSPYKRFEVVVGLEPVWESSGSAMPKLPSGFVAVMRIGMPGLRIPLVTPICVTADNQKPFATEADALMAGYSAGQRVIEGTLVPE